MLYEYHSEHQTYNNEQIRTVFYLWNQQINSIPLIEVENAIYSFCDMCRNHERSGFITGIKTGIHLVEEIDWRRHLFEFLIMLHLSCWNGIILQIEEAVGVFYGGYDNSIKKYVRTSNPHPICGTGGKGPF